MQCTVWKGRRHCGAVLLHACCWYYRDHPTARVDLLGLVELGLLDQDRRSKAFVFMPVSDLARRLER